MYHKFLALQLKFIYGIAISGVAQLIALMEINSIIRYKMMQFNFIDSFKKYDLTELFPTYSA